MARDNGQRGSYRHVSPTKDNVRELPKPPDAMRPSGPEYTPRLTSPRTRTMATSTRRPSAPRPRAPPPPPQPPRQRALSAPTRYTALPPTTSSNSPPTCSTSPPSPSTPASPSCPSPAPCPAPACLPPSPRRVSGPPGPTWPSPTSSTAPLPWDSWSSVSHLSPFFPEKLLRDRERPELGKKKKKSAVLILCISVRRGRCYWWPCLGTRLRLLRELGPLSGLSGREGIRGRRGTGVYGIRTPWER